MPQSIASPPHLPASLAKGVLNDSNIVAQGSGDDNSILPIPDHTAIDHLAASPITKGLLSVGMTKRFRRKFVTCVFGTCAALIAPALCTTSRCVCWMPKDVCMRRVATVAARVAGSSST